LSRRRGFERLGKISPLLIARNELIRVSDCAQ
jgi:hypothetical protein